MFGAVDKIICLRLEMKACSGKGKTRLKLKVDMFGDRDELTRLAIETYSFGTEYERVSQQATHALAG